VISVVKGVITSREGNRLVVNVGGVGLEIYVPLRLLSTIGREGEEVELRTHFHVREDALTLYGFTSESEKKLFQSLLGVSGVGPKVALAILSVSEAAELARLIHEEKTGALTAFPGIGKKTAERIVLELRDKIDMEQYIPSGARTPSGLDRKLVEEALGALSSLGLSRASAEKALARISFDSWKEPPSVEDIVREALRNVSSK
jgi:Holliday junction DNA helicase RuvA